ncbi:hypothetical protein B0H34DRAFT_808533 [Crassisporium funariophilum]|nr:hypothetical protein B0H34DRAFT_808533 [Crassisporium funariophilum]
MAQLEWPFFTTVSVNLSAVSYGIVLSLFFSCIHRLRTSSKASQRMRYFLFAYVIVMFLLSTLGMIVNIIGHLISYPTITGLPESIYNLFWDGTYSPVGEACSVFITWGGDGFLLWRSIILYQDLTRLRKISLYVGLCVLSLMLFVLHPPRQAGIEVPLSVFFAISLFCNLVITSLIVLRLVHHSRYISLALGRRTSSLYTRVITMCLESATLLVVVNATFMGLFFAASSNATNLRPDRFVLSGISLFPQELLIHVYVISAFMIISRVAQGKAETTNYGGPESYPGIEEVVNSRRLTPINFNKELSCTHDQTRLSTQHNDRDPGVEISQSSALSAV